MAGTNPVRAERLRPTGNAKWEGDRRASWNCKFQFSGEIQYPARAQMRMIHALENTGPMEGVELSDSPCIGICTLDQQLGLCTGCARTLGEIAEWAAASPSRRVEILKSLPARRPLIPDYLGDWD